MPDVAPSVPVPTPMDARRAASGQAPPPKPARSPVCAFLSKYTEQYAIPPHLAPAALQICIIAFPLGLLAGLALPQALRFLVVGSQTIFSSPQGSAVDAETAWYLLPQLHVYLLAWCLFHLLEFTITAAYNPTRLYSDSFLLNNGIAYHLAHLGGLLEFALTASLIRPESKRPNLFTLLGLVLVALGQGFRSLAMIHAHNNFSHIVADKKRHDHQLIKTGVYALTRHPSYVGFFYWALGTQILLGNALGCVAFAIVLWRFFSHRIKIEEEHLVEFFQDEYVQYKKEVGTHLPFIA